MRGLLQEYAADSYTMNLEGAQTKLAEFVSEANNHPDSFIGWVRMKIFRPVPPELYRLMRESLIRDTAVHLPFADRENARELYRSVLVSDNHYGSVVSHGKLTEDLYQHIAPIFLIQAGDWNIESKVSRTLASGLPYRSTFRQSEVHAQEAAARVPSQEKHAVHGNHDPLPPDIKQPFDDGYFIHHPKSLVFALEDGTRVLVTHGDEKDGVNRQDGKDHIGGRFIAAIEFLDREIVQRLTDGHYSLLNLMIRLPLFGHFMAHHISQIVLELVKEAKANGCTMVVSGHLHKTFRVEWDGVTVIGNGDMTTSGTATFEINEPQTDGTTKSDLRTLRWPRPEQWNLKPLRDDSLVIPLPYERLYPPARALVGHSLLDLNPPETALTPGDHDFLFQDSSVMRYRVSGSDRPDATSVIYLHGLDSSRLERIPGQEKILKELKLKMIFIDLPGIGGSTRLPDYTRRELAGRLELLTQAILQPREAFILAGESAGAMAKRIS